MLSLNGQKLSLEEVASVARGAEQVTLAPAARVRVEAARRVVENILEEGRVVYGVNTGFGKLADVHIPPSELRALQLNLVRSHACGVGQPLSIEETRAMLLLRANVIALGYSGARALVVETLIAMLERGVHPVIPAKGSVGASGDLAPLAHLALVVIGEGEAFFEGERLAGADAMRRAGLEPVQLEAKEGLALLNGTQAMAAVGGLALHRALSLARIADVAGAMTLEALRGTPAAFDARIHSARPHQGQMEVAKHLRELLLDSEIRDSHLDNDPRVQDAYSLRCMPQVHGAVRGALHHARDIVEIETGSATDNPLIFIEDEGGKHDSSSIADDSSSITSDSSSTTNASSSTINNSSPVINRPSSIVHRPSSEVISGGNFHGAPLALAFDYAAMALTDLASLSERRTERLVNPDLSEGLPAFLTAHPGTSSGFMIAQVSAVALLNEMKVLAHPASIDNLPTSAGKEDHVSMGMTAANKLRTIVEDAEHVLAIELLAAAEGLEYRAPLQPGRGVRRAFEIVRAHVPRLTQDRALSTDIEKISAAIRRGEFDV